MRYLADVTTLAYAADKCTGCGRCVEVCLRAVFEMREKRAAVSDRDLCMECGACARNCDFGAITVNAGVGCAAAIINSMVTGGPPTCDCSGDAGGASTRSSSSPRPSSCSAAPSGRHSSASR